MKTDLSAASWRGRWCFSLCEGEEKEKDGRKKDGDDSDGDGERGGVEADVVPGFPDGDDEVVEYVSTHVGDFVGVKVG